jgi:hypothetical protein
MILTKLRTSTIIINLTIFFSNAIDETGESNYELIKMDIKDCDK